DPHVFSTYLARCPHVDEKTATCGCDTRDVAHTPPVIRAPGAAHMRERSRTSPAVLTRVAETRGRTTRTWRRSTMKSRTWIVSGVLGAVGAGAAFGTALADDAPSTTPASGAVVLGAGSGAAATAVASEPSASPTATALPSTTTTVTVASTPTTVSAPSPVSTTT